MVRSTQIVLTFLTLEEGLTNKELSDVGGAETHTLSSSEMPNHTHTASTNTTGSHGHTVNDPGHFHTFTTINDDYNGSSDNPPGFTTDSTGLKYWNTDTKTTGITIENNGNHSHTVTVNSTGGGQPHNNMQPYIALRYIIRH